MERRELAIVQFRLTNLNGLNGLGLGRIPITWVGRIELHELTHVGCG